MGLWHKCNICKKPIDYSQTFWTCNVSTCNRRRTWLKFCSVTCYDAHLPGMNHRESWALEIKAPAFEVWTKYSEEHGEDAVWPPPPPKVVVKEEAALPSGGFGTPNTSSSQAPVIRRRKH